MMTLEFLQMLHVEVHLTFCSVLQFNITLVVHASMGKTLIELVTDSYSI